MKRGEPDYAPLFLFGLLGIATAGVFTSMALYEKLRAQRKLPSAEPPPDGTPPDDGEPTS